MGLQPEANNEGMPVIQLYSNRTGILMHEDSGPVTIPSVDSNPHEFRLRSTFYIFPPGTNAWQLLYLAIPN